MKHCYFLFLLFVSTLAGAQTLTIVSPEGMTEPYEVAPNTSVTFQWDYFEEAPTKAFSYSEMPDFSSQPGADPAWTQYSAFTDNGDGTYNFTLTVSDEVWIWAGFYQSFFGSYAFSNVFHFQISSGVVISYDDGFICPDGSDTELLSVADTFPTYQWYRNSELIAGATSATYAATESGDYKVQVPLDTASVFSNMLHVSTFLVDVQGSYDVSATSLSLTATPGFETYQWFSGADSTNMTPISGADGSTYATNLPAQATYYAVEVTNGSCTLMSNAHLVSPATFSIPNILVAADTNSFGNICTGTTITLSTDTIYGTYLWMKDGQSTYSIDPTYSFSQSYQAGNYTIQVSPPGWPEIILESDAINAQFFDLTSPALFSDDSDNKYCPDQTVNITLSDEGYDYTWYAYTGDTYSESDIVSVTGQTYTFTYDSTLKITVVADYQGCSKSTTKTLNSWAQQSPYISLVDYNGGYLCTDSVEAIRVSPFSASNYHNYQWGRIVNGEFEPVADSIQSSILAADTGLYVVHAEPLSCPVTVISNSVHIAGYLDRPLNIYATPEEICLGDTAELHIQSGSQWQDIQWFKQYINGFNPNDEQFNPLIGGGNAPTQEVNEFYRYRAKARFVGCPTGEKITSNIVSIRPRVNPPVTVLPEYGIYETQTSPYDSIEHRVFCNGEVIDLSVPDQYDQYSWLTTTYSAINYYTPGGEPLSGEDADTLSFQPDGAFWITAQVDSSGCVGYSDPILIDHWVFLAPTIQSYGNAELCAPGDSTLLNLGFPGDWLSFQWYLDGVPIPNSNNDSIYATEPGMYVLEAVPTLCPSFAYSSGVGPIVTFLTATIAENDTVIYALPELGTYTYQWYLDGNPIPSPPETPWLLYKDSMEDGVYTVAVTNPDSCTSVSDPYNWETSGLEDPIFAGLRIYPNPASDAIHISGIEQLDIERILLFDALGRQVDDQVRIEVGNQLSVKQLKPGVYILQIELTNGKVAQRKVVRN